jgi:small subunit ribosomal protein S9
MAPTKEPVKKATHPAHPATHAAHPTTHTPAASKARYTEATGRRKTAIARVRISAGNGKVTVNDKDLKGYFTLPRLMAAAISPLVQLNLAKDFDVSVHVSGGGINAQAEAVRHGISQAIVMKDAAWKPRLRAMGYMTRDSRMVERKKYGLRKARRAPQWAKR